MNKNQKLALALVILILGIIAAALSVRKSSSTNASPTASKMPKLDTSAPRFSE